jgi:hypothetical protein
MENTIHYNNYFSLIYVKWKYEIVRFHKQMYQISLFKARILFCQSQEGKMVTAGLKSVLTLLYFFSRLNVQSKQLNHSTT